MGKVVITVEYNDGMKMNKDMMTKNIAYILEKHFESIQSYATVNPPRVAKIEVENNE